MWRNLALAASLVIVASPARAASIDRAPTRDPLHVAARAALIDRVIGSAKLEGRDRTTDVGSTLILGAAAALARWVQLLHFRAVRPSDQTDRTFAGSVREIPVSPYVGVASGFLAEHTAAIRTTP